MADKTPAQIEAERKAKENQAKTEHKTAPGAASTYNASRGEYVGPDPRGDTFFTHDEIHALAGDIKPGQLGFLKLDEDGTPEGKVIFDRVAPDEGPVATVIAGFQPKFDEIVTPSGAPISKFMNPDPTLWDEGMAARNPVVFPREGEPRPVGGGVVNQPVTR